ncbi:MAG: archaellin/type IV pilin N-terminal domain-containing protein [Ignisphaera sp.]
MGLIRCCLKGVSPVIATIILILITVSAGVLLWLWISTFASSSPIGQNQALRERMKIEAVNVNMTGKKIIAFVRNVGDVPIQIVTAYILDINGNVVDVQEINGTSITPGKLAKISIDISRADTVMVPGFSYRLKLITSNGVENEYIFVYSS